MKSFTKHLLIVCAVCATTGIASHSTAFAANNEDKSSIESSQITTSSSAVISNTDNNSTNTEDSIEDKSISTTKDDTSSSEKNTLSSTNTESSAESSEKSKNTYSTNNNETTTTNYSQKVNSDSSNVVTKDNVASTKTWQVKFNQPVTIDSLEGKIELINETTNAEVPITITMVENSLDQTVLITPSVALDFDNEYHLSISQSITSKFGKVLSNPTIVSFKTQSSISSINDINLTIKQGGAFTLPTTVDATMSDGTTSKVAISWDKQLNSTRSPGNYTFNGTVSGYKNTVKLNLTIEAVPQSPSPTDGKRTQNATELKLYNYLSDYTNRNSVYDRAVQIHASLGYGDDPYSNNCAFYQSTALRSIGINIPNSTANTRTLTNVLTNLGWKISYDLSLLLPGDICFTIGASNGTGPTHTYTFMKWADPDDFHYAYICDNQGGDWPYTDDGNTDAYHERSIDTQTSIADKISYFMYPPA